MEAWDNDQTRVSEAFLGRIEMFGVLYAEYVSTFNEALDALRVAETSVGFARFHKVGSSLCYRVMVCRCAGAVVRA